MDGSAPESSGAPLPPPQRESLLDNGYITMVASTFSITPERAEQVTFAGPYLLTHQAVLVKSDNPIADVTDLDDEIVCFVSGTTAAANLQSVKPDVNGPDPLVVDTLKPAFRWGSEVTSYHATQDLYRSVQA